MEKSRSRSELWVRKDSYRRQSIYAYRICIKKWYNIVTVI